MKSMMFFKACTLVGLATLLIGCQDPLRLVFELAPHVPVTSFAGHGVVSSSVVRSEVEVFGDEMQLTFLRGSYIPRLAVVGHNNRIRIAEGAAVARIELAGYGNKVVYAQGSPLVITQLGDNELRSAGDEGADEGG